MRTTTEQVWQGVATNQGDGAIGAQLLQLDLAAFPVENDGSTTS